MQPFLNGSISAAYSLGCFDCIPEAADEDMSAEEISSKTGAEKAIVGMDAYSPLFSKARLIAGRFASCEC
jgi:hypothetical protein